MQINMVPLDFSTVFWTLCFITCYVTRASLIPSSTTVHVLSNTPATSTGSTLPVATSTLRFSFQTTSQTLTISASYNILPLTSSTVPSTLHPSSLFSDNRALYHSSFTSVFQKWNTELVMNGSSTTTVPSFNYASVVQIKPTPSYTPTLIPTATAQVKWELRVFLVSYCCSQFSKR